MSEKEEYMNLMEKHPELRTKALQILAGKAHSCGTERPTSFDDLTEQEKLFLNMASNPELRKGLEARLEALGLLPSFLQAENKTPSP